MSRRALGFAASTVSICVECRPCYTDACPTVIEQQRTSACAKYTSGRPTPLIFSPDFQSCPVWLSAAIAGDDRRICNSAIHLGASPLSYAVSGGRSFIVSLIPGRRQRSQSRQPTMSGSISSSNVRAGDFTTSLNTRFRETRSRSSPDPRNTECATPSTRCGLARRRSSRPRVLP